MTVCRIDLYYRLRFINIIENSYLYWILVQPIVLYITQYIIITKNSTNSIITSTTRSSDTKSSSITRVDDNKKYTMQAAFLHHVTQQAAFLTSSSSSAVPVVIPATNNNNHSSKNDTVITIQFTDFSDLQTRLVLMPRIEDEGIGAIVASYFFNEDIDNNSIDNTIDVSGYVVIGIVSNESNIDNNENNIDNKEVSNDYNYLCDLEFSTILSRIRQAPTPIILSFQLKVPSKDILVDNKQQQKQQQQQQPLALTNSEQQLGYIKNDFGANNDSCSEEKKIEMDDIPLSSRILISNNQTPASETETAMDTNVSEASTALDETTNNSTEPVATSQTTGTNAATTTTATTASATASFWTKRFMDEAANLARAANERATKLAVAATATTASTASAKISSVLSQEDDTQSNRYAIFKQCNQSGEFRRLSKQQVRRNSNELLVVDSNNEDSVSSSVPTVDEGYITNTSLLAVRISSTQSCRVVSGQSFQWYRSSKSSNNKRNNSSLNQYTYNDTTITDYDNDNNNNIWQIIPGAEYPVFQPSATEVGYRLKCEIRVPTLDIDNRQNVSEDLVTTTHTNNVVVVSTAATDTSNDIDNDCIIPNVDEKESNNDDQEIDDDDSSVSSNGSSNLLNDTTTRSNNTRDKRSGRPQQDQEQQIVVQSDDVSIVHVPASTVICCEILTSVQAESSLFNGARQALIRGAQFSGLTGLGNAEGRQLGLRVRLARRKQQSQYNPKQASAIVCAVTVYQIVGDVTEPVHNVDYPMICVSAISDASNAKQFEMILAAQSTRTDSQMISALTSPFIEYDDIDTDSLNNSVRSSSSANINNNNNNTNDGSLLRLQLQAPNRLARESLLLAIGVANFTGRASDLNESVTLYDNDKIPCTPSSWSLASSKSNLSLSLLTSASDGGDADSRISTIGDDEFEDNRSLDSARTPTKVNFLTPDGLQQQNLQTPEPFAIHHRAVSSLSRMNSVTDAYKITNLEDELALLREKLLRKDKIISELQRSIVHADDTTQQVERRLQQSEEETRKVTTSLQHAQAAIQKAETRISYQENTIESMKQQYKTNDLIQQKLQQEQTTKIAELEKANRALHNEKAVLSAAVEARESKLVQMVDLKASLATATAKLSHQEAKEKEIVEYEKRVVTLKQELDSVRKAQDSVQLELVSSKSMIDTLQKQIQIEVGRTKGHKIELEKEQMAAQKLKAERNSYKQKGESLSKEISRVCRNGRTMRDIEKIIADELIRKQEMESLRVQKQCALDDAQTYRILMEQAQITQKLMGKSITTEYESMNIAKLVHRNTELERLVSELTEFITAKEMQLDTMKQINDTLQLDIRSSSLSSKSLSITTNSSTRNLRPDEV